MRYRRTRVDGGAYFFTVNLAERRSSLLVDYIDVLRKVVGMVKERHPFTIDAVILPKHLHAVWTLPPGDADYPRPGCSSKRDSRGISTKRNAGAPATGAAASAKTIAGATPREHDVCWGSFLTPTYVLISFHK